MLHQKLTLLVEKLELSFNPLFLFVSYVNSCMSGPLVYVDDLTTDCIQISTIWV